PSESAGARPRRPTVAAGQLPAAGSVVRQARTPQTLSPAGMGVSCDHGAEGASRHRELVPLDDGTVDFAVREDRAVLVDGPHAAGHPMVVDRIGRVRGDFDMRPDRAGAPVSDPN